MTNSLDNLNDFFASTATHLRGVADLRGLSLENYLQAEIVALESRITEHKELLEWLGC